MAVCSTFFVLALLRSSSTTTWAFAPPTKIALATLKMGARASSSAAASASSSPSSSDNEKQIIFVRHSITYMNEYLGRSLRFGAPGFTDVFSEKDRAQKYQDSPLSPNGIKLVQRELASQPPSFIKDDNNNNDIDLIVVSPLRRALQTYDLGLRPHLKHRDIPVVALPDAAERLYLISDVGSPVSKLQQEFTYVNFDHMIMPNNNNNNNDSSLNHHPWWWTPPKSNNGRCCYTEWRPTGQGQRYACPGEPAADFAARMQRLRTWLQDRPEQNIVVVCHHGVIDFMIDMDFDNCQWRKVPFSKLLATTCAPAITRKN